MFMGRKCFSVLSVFLFFVRSFVCSCFTQAWRALNLHFRTPCRYDNFKSFFMSASKNKSHAHAHQLLCFIRSKHLTNVIAFRFFSLSLSISQTDWTRPLTPPATNRHLKSATPKTGSNVPQTTKTAIITKNNTVNNNNNNTINTASDAVADTNRANKLATTENLAPNYANQPDLGTSPSTIATNTITNTSISTAAATTATPLTSAGNDATTTVLDESAVQSLALRLQNELRRAKSQHLACTEVLLPSDLLNRIASELIVMSEKEPCGIRGSIIYIEFEDEPNNTR